MNEATSSSTGATKRSGLGFARTLVGDDIEDTLLRGWTAAGILR